MRYVAARFAEKGDRASLERAADLEPHNAEYRARLGRYLLYTEQDAGSALRNFQAAAALNPYSASTWLSIAQAQLIMGNQGESLGATQRAIETDPKTPSVAWEAATLFVANGRIEAALPELRFVLANDPAMLLQGLRLVGRLESSPARAAHEAVPPEPAIQFAYMNQLVQAGNIDGARQVWPVVLGLRQAFDPKLTFFFLNALREKDEVDASLNYWNELAKVSPQVARLNEPGNLIHNASFEYDSLNGGFDWLYAASDQVSLRSETSDAHTGRRSLLVTFLGQRTSDIGMHQYVVLQPKTHYRFRGYMKTALQTADGLQFILVDVKNNRHLFETADSVDDRAWKEYSAEFVTPANADLCLLLIGRTAHTLISGNALVDDLRLEKVSP